MDSDGHISKRDGDLEYSTVSQKLAEIVTNVSVKLDVEKSRKWKINNKNARDLFVEYGLKTLTKRVNQVEEEMNKEKQMSLL